MIPQTPTDATLVGSTSGPRSPSEAPISFPSVVLRLPIPPSTNKLFSDSPWGHNAKSGKRVKSAAYKAWRQEAGWELLQQHPPQIEGDVEVNIFVGPRIVGADVDNRIKGLLDLLVDHRVLVDDHHVVRVTCEWVEEAGCRVVITARTAFPR